MSRFLTQEIIAHKRDSLSLDVEQINQIVAGITNESISEGQVAAFAMAVFLNGMSVDEKVALTLAMRDSGTVLTWPELDGPVIDKHSTGGVGDNVSLVLAPLIAACGGYVPMISGRGLGHTGGTLDKFDSIPGYQTMPGEALFRRVTKNVGAAIIGQTADLAPADKRLYAIRDVTATVESIPLITASILSKKLAAGLGFLTLDIKCGNGAFMKDIEQANELGQSLVQVANGAGLKTTALVTDMDQPLASAAGNALEMLNAVHLLTGEHKDLRLTKVVLELAAQMLYMGNFAASLEEAQNLAKQALDTGMAAEKFSQMVHGLGGPSDFLQRPKNYLKSAPVIMDIVSNRRGYISKIDAFSIGLNLIELGGGRRIASDQIDHSVGFDQILPVGSEIEKGDILGRVHASSVEAAQIAQQKFMKAIKIGDKVPNSPLILQTIG